MSSSQQLIGNLPSGIDSFKIGISAHDGEYFEISDNVSELSLYESIYYPYIHGSMVVIDNSMMLADIPFIGQERVFFQWTRDDRPLTRVFYITKVSNIGPASDAAASYELSINSVVQVRNAVNLFSQSYRGRSDEIITAVFGEHLGAAPTPMEGVQGKTMHNVVFPYMKPLQAVDMIRKNVLADDDTPMFVYDTFYPNEIRLDSFGRMMARPPIVDISSVKPSNRDEDAQATRRQLDSRGAVYDEGISRAYDTFDRLNKGVFASTVTIADPSIKEYDKVDFQYKTFAPPRSKDWISDDYRVFGSHPNNLLNTRNMYLPRNALAYNDDFPNINTIEDFDRSILNSFISRHAMSVVKIYMDSIAYTLKDDLPFSVGQTVNYKLLKFMPALSEGDTQLDDFNSGKYVISAIRHFIKNKEYTMSIELIRDGVGEKAEFRKR